jgi:flavin reductase (DIM6/NTAB) family NADH-FMN oxidoreductase RutF
MAGNASRAKGEVMKTIEPRALRDAFGSFLTGVTVVTAYDQNKQPIGFTANSFSSVSLDPPLLLVCLSNSSSNFDALTNANGFAINVLAETQIEISNTFASPVEDRFSDCEWQNGPFGGPVIEGVSAWFDCSTHNIVQAGDHVILIGKVEAFEAGTAPGLGYARGAYVTSALETEVLVGRSNFIVSALVERNGQVLLMQDKSGGLSLPERQVGKSGATEALRVLIKDCGITAAPGFVYSVFEDANDHQPHISFLCQAAEGEPAKGAFLDLDAATLELIADRSLRSMLERFATESNMDNYGVYFDQSDNNDTV